MTGGLVALASAFLRINTTLLYNNRPKSSSVHVTVSNTLPSVRKASDKAP